MKNRLKIKVTGKNTNYFFKELLRNKINIYNLNKSKSKLELIIDEEDYEKIKQIKTTNKIKIIDYFGISKLKYLLKKYRLIIIFFILSIFFNIFLSNIIFSVEINNSNKVLVKEIKSELEKMGLKKYNLALSTKKLNTIKNKLLENKDIEWIEIERVGTKYIVNVEMRKLKSKEAECKPRNIVSKKNAVITRIEAEKGEIVKKKDDYVVKGETIISGLIHNKETVKNKVCVVGKVYGNTWYTVHVKFSQNETIKKQTNKKKHSLTIKILNKNILYNNNLKNYKIKQYNIIDSKIIPINIGVSKYYEIKEYKRLLTDKSQDEKALSEATKAIKKRLPSDATIIDKKILKKSINNSKIEVDVFIVAEENITDYFDISTLDIDELNKKEEWLGVRSIK